MFLTLFNSCVMIPIYLTGDPIKIYDDQTIAPSINATDKITVLNITNNSGKMAFTYFASLFLISIGLIIMI